eukprot:7178782-Prymnesium_polylepis.1
MQEIERKFECVHRTVHGDATNINRIMNTCEEMLTDRGCLRIQKADDIASAILQSSAVIEGTKNDDETIDIYISDDARVGVKYTRFVMDKSQRNHIIVVSLEGPTPFARKECDGHSIQFMMAAAALPSPSA